MNKKAVALIFSILAIIILSMSMTAIFFKSVNNNNLISRRVHSIRAFWLAETGVAEAAANLPNSPLGDYIGNPQGCPTNTNCYYNTTSADVTVGNITYYRIDSTGSVDIPSGGTITRDVEVFVKVTPPEASNFGHAIESTGEINQLGAGVTINGTIDDFATINFSDLFGNSKTEVRNAADQIYDETSFAEPLIGVTWVDDADGGADLIMNGNLTGNGILIIEGNVLIAGTVTFDGIIYVIGELTTLGNATLSGTVIAESGVGIDTTVGGSVTITHDPVAIADALNFIQFLSYEIVSWQETG
ncbi:MAG: hypothetical protein NG737_07165 [Omnitrophica bacterium]|nr:hypothetical protein [Candidatus Omnitrophota bacterium]